MIRAGIHHREPASGAKHPRCLGEVLRSKDTDYWIDGGVLHRPFGPQIRDGECQYRPSPRSLSRRIFGNIEANTDDRRWQGCRYPRKVMPRARTGIQDAPPPEYRLGFDLLHVFRDLRRDDIEMACVEE